MRGDSKEGRKEVSAYRLLQWREERGSVGDYSLDILPFVLQTEGETRVRCLRVPLSNSAEGDHCSRPLVHHLGQPFPLLLSAPNEAAEVALPSRVVDVKEHFEQCLRLTFVVCHGICQTQWELQSGCKLMIRPCAQLDQKQ